MSSIYTDNKEKIEYVSLINIEKDIITNTIYEYIDDIIKNDKNIFDNKLKAIKVLKESLHVHIGIKCSIFSKYFYMELFIFSKEPIITIDGEFYVHKFSIIGRQQQYIEVHQSEIHISLKKLFDITFNKLLNKLHI